MLLIEWLVFLFGMAIQGLLLGVFLRFLVLEFLKRVPEPFAKERLFRDEVLQYKEENPNVPYRDKEACKKIGREAFHLGIPFWYGDYKVQETKWWSEGWRQARDTYAQMGHEYVSLFPSDQDFDPFGNVPPVGMWEIEEHKLYLKLAGKFPKYP